MPFFCACKRFFASSDFMRYAIAYVYLHFGLLKLFPDLSPAELLAEQAILKLTFNVMSGDTALRLLAFLEIAIGLALLIPSLLRWTFPILIGHIVLTFSPLFLLPELTFKVFPFAPNLEGQFILKNIAIFAGAWAVLYPRAFSPQTSERGVGASAPTDKTADEDYR